MSIKETLMNIRKILIKVVGNDSFRRNPNYMEATGNRGRLKDCNDEGAKSEDKRRKAEVKSLNW
jgi:hypothetical protein